MKPFLSWRSVAAVSAAVIAIGVLMAQITVAAPSQPVTIWLAGDSTVFTGSGAKVGWGAALKPYFNANVTVKNQAVSGRSIQTWLYEGNVTSSISSNGECRLSGSAYNARWTSMLSGFKAGDWLVVQFGINDADRACPRHVGSARYQELLGVMAQAARSRGVNVIFNTPVAAIICSGSAAVGNRGFLTETRSAAQANGVPVVDLHALSVALYNRLRMCPNNGDYRSTTSAVGRFFADDHTHFSAEGARQIAGLVAGDVDSQGLGLADWLANRTTTTTRTSTTSTTTTPTTTTTTTTTTPTTTTSQPTTTTTVPGPGSCMATLTVTSNWPGGFVANVTVTAGTSAITGWRVTLALPSETAITNAWNAGTSGGSGTVQAVNAPYNGTLAAGQGTQFGLQGTGSAAGTAVTCATA